MNRLLIGVLSTSPFRRSDDKLFEELPLYLELIADRWNPARTSNHPKISAVD
jgi:hypothetical protein